MRRSSPLALVLLAGCAACVPKREAPPPAPPPVTVAPPPVATPLAARWEDWPVAAGDWAYRKDARGSIALFGPAGADARFTVRCDRPQGRFYLSRAGGSGSAMTVRTTSTTRAVPAQQAGGSPAYLAAELPVSDTLVDAMGYSRGRFVVETPGQPPLVMPSWAEVLRVVEDCR